MTNEDYKFSLNLLKTYISYHNNSIYQLKLDSIEKLIDIRKEGISDDDLKYDFNFLIIGHEKLPIWTPNSKILFALMNILRMFPLRENT